MEEFTGISTECDACARKVVHRRLLRAWHSIPAQICAGAGNYQRSLRAWLYITRRQLKGLSQPHALVPGRSPDGTALEVAVVAVAVGEAALRVEVAVVAKEKNPLHLLKQRW